MDAVFAPWVKNRLKRAGAVLAALALVCALVCLLLPRSYLVLYNLNSQAVAYAAPLAQGEEFSVSYTHSVNKSEVDEVYRLSGEDILLTRLIYGTFGAGMTTDYTAEGGKSFYLNDEGRMVIEGYDIVTTNMVYNVAVIADHVLHIKGREIHLNTIAQPKQALRFELRRLSPLAAARL